MCQTQRIGNINELVCEFLLVFKPGVCKQV
jgi:hypothetical protein